MALHLHEGKSRWADRRPPVPPRVDAYVKAGQLDLLEHAGARGWPLRPSAAPAGRGRDLGDGLPKWLATLVSAEESSVQVEVAFLAALDAEDLLVVADTRASAALRVALAAGDRDTIAAAVGDGQVPLLLAVSDIHTDGRRTTANRGWNSDRSRT